MTMERGDNGGNEPIEGEKGPKKPEIREVKEKPSMSRMQELIAGFLIVLSAAKAGEVKVFAKDEKPLDERGEKEEKYTAEFGGVPIKELQEHGLVLTKIETIIRDVSGQDFNTIACEEITQSLSIACKTLGIELSESPTSIAEAERLIEEQRKSAKLGSSEAITDPYYIKARLQVSSIKEETKAKIDREEIRGVSRGVGAYREGNRVVFGGGIHRNKILRGQEKETQETIKDFIARVTLELIGQDGRKKEGIGIGELIESIVTEQKNKNREGFLYDRHVEQSTISTDPDIVRQVRLAIAQAIGQLTYFGKN